MLTTEDIRMMSVEEIAEKVATCKKDLYALRVQSKTGKLEKQHRIQELRRDIARLLTIANEMKRDSKKAK